MARTEVKRLLVVWKRMALMSTQTYLVTTWATAFFIIGKIVRFLMFFIFLFVVLSSGQSLAGYSREQVIIFFLIFNLVDITAQLLFRSVYGFRWLVVSGNFDMDLLNPLPSFFRPLFGEADVRI